MTAPSTGPPAPAARTATGPPPANPRLAAALYYASLNWFVFPIYEPLVTGERPVCSCPKGAACADIGKHPRYCKELLPKGHLSATTDPDAITAMWTKWPNANIGLAVGASGLIAIDEDLAGAVAEYERLHGPLPTTIEQATGRAEGGRHMLFKHPGGKIRGELGDNIQIKDNGYIVLSPSMHRTGRPYAWKDGHSPGDRNAAEPTASWRDLVAKREGPLSHGQQGQQGQHPSPTTPPVGEDHVTMGVAERPCDTTPRNPPRRGRRFTAEELILMCAVTGPQQHDDQNFRLARGARWNLGLAEHEAESLLFWPWHGRYHQNMREPDAAMALEKFLRAYMDCDTAIGETDIHMRARERAQQLPLPAGADKLPTPEVRLLAATLAVIQADVGDRDFVFTTRQAGEVMGVPESSRSKIGSRMMNLLAMLKLAACRDRGRQRDRSGAGGRAGKWRWLGIAPADSAVVELGVAA
jgi:hypothetical protein